MIRIARLEACWSPFLPGSDVSRLDRAGGAPVAVRPETVTLVIMAAATIATAGAFDPTVTNQARDVAHRYGATCLVRGRDDRR